MTTAGSDSWIRRDDAHVYEVLGRVLGVLCDTGPLRGCFGLRLWPMLLGPGYVLVWLGVTPTEDEVVGYLAEAAANDDFTTDLRPGDVTVVAGEHYTTVKVRGVLFQLRAEPMVEPETFAKMGEYWRTGELHLTR